MPKIIIASLLLVAALPAYADQDYMDARKHVESMLNGLITEVKANTAVYSNDQEKLFALIEAKVLPSVDIPRFSRLILGKHWKTASAAQREAFEKSLHNTLLNSYGKSLVLLSEVKEVEFPDDGSATKSKKFKLVMSTMLFEGGQKPISINYALKKKEGQWLIFDLIIDGVSVGKQLRSSFNREISSKGLNALITRISSQSSLN